MTAPTFSTIRPNPLDDAPATFAMSAGKIETNNITAAEDPLDHLNRDPFYLFHS
jgi:hypothetical protein